MVVEKVSDKKSEFINESYESSSDQSNFLSHISVHAFCITDELCSVMESFKVDHKMDQVDMQITKGSIAEAINIFSESVTPNLLIINIKGDSEEILNSLNPLADVCDTSTKVVIIGDRNDVYLYKELISSGISEYLVEPLSSADIIRVLINIYDISVETVGKVISFIGSRGGVGSSTIAHNCSFSIASILKMKTVLVDLDLPYGTSNIDFDQDPIKCISDAIYNNSKIDRFFIDKLLVSYSDNLSLLTSPSTLERTYDFDSDDIFPLIDILYRSSSFTIIDVPNLWNSWARDLLVESDKVVITTSLDLTGLRNSKNLIDELKKLRNKDDSIYLVINQIGIPKRPEISIEDFCSPLGIKPSAVIPFDANLFGIAANNGKMISEINPKSSINAIFSDFIHILADCVTMNKPKRGIRSKITSFFNRK
ncbi:Flp pilus assembly protein, ATPase CpaE [Candidatus Liberibacter americanus str. Sao Paulo]|uniref:Flp pilus assembly protein, ATPase CpaE n=2 Tax=Candidatus Liberibacter americanus TaxID=309868 RepID=U6B6U9_9HYPH|nr:Flp pilus assembly protein, ATPase CpaE [Candidatus Liberibacter americanus str. Sao Paulo]EMS36309.1 response regulator receiver protein [Candidatus Liberibacter americanus PW_SP]